MTVVYHPSVQREVSAILRRYDRVNPKLGDAFWQEGKANVVFCDGHVESPRLKFVFEDTSDAALARWNRDHQPHRDKL